MSPDAQRIAIAEACGWRKGQAGWDDNITVYRKDGMWVYPKDIPDYLTDLNAMHEAEKVVIEKDVRLYLRYGQELIKLSGQGMFDAMFATAAQRAEAFLRTLNLWTT